MSIDRYRVFIEVVRSGSLQQAARNLNQSPSTVSYTIARLEGELGLPLFHRDRSGVHLTRYGNEILPHVEAILDRQGDIERIGRDYQSSTTGQLRIGGTQVFMSRVLTGLLDGFHREYPNIEITPVIRPVSSMERDLIEGVMDMAFKPVIVSERLQFFHLLDSDFVFILPEGDARGQAERLSFADLAGEKFIFPEWFLIYPWLRRLEDRTVGLGVPRENILYADDILSTISLAQNHYGVGVLYTSVLPVTRQFLCPVVEEFEPYPIGIAAPKSAVSPLGKRFIQFSRQYFTAHDIQL